MLHDAGKVKTLELRKSFFGAEDFVEVIVEKNLGINGLGFNKKTISNVTRTILGYDFNKKCLASKKTIKKFIFKNHDIIENIIEIKNVIKNENKSYGRRVRSGNILRKVYNEMLKAGSPFDVRDLQIRGDDIIRAHPHIDIEKIDEVVENLLLTAALKPKKNNKLDLLKVAKRMINSKRDYYLEEC